MVPVGEARALSSAADICNHDYVTTSVKERCIQENTKIIALVLPLTSVIMINATT